METLSSKPFDPLFGAGVGQLVADYGLLEIEFLIFAGFSLMVLLVLGGRIPLRYNVRNIVVRWRTTAMTGLAFTLVISLLVVMLAFVQGMIRLTEQSGIPGNVVLLGAGVTDEAFSNLGYSDTGNIENQPLVLRDGDRPLCSKETYFIINQPIERPTAGGPKRRFVQVRGIVDPEISGRVHGLPLYTGGEWFSPAGVRAAPADSAPAASTPSPEASAEAANETAVANGAASDAGGGDGPAATFWEAVVGEGVARELGRDLTMRDLPSVKTLGRLDVGDTFSLAGRTWLIVGVMQSAGSTYDSEVWAKHSLVGRMLGKEAYSTIVLRTQDQASAVRLKTFFNSEFKEASLQALLETEYFSSLSGTSKQFTYAIGVVAVVMAIGGVFGIMNTMFAAISQRSRDIGVLRILGYARWQVLVSFLLESVLIALLGGASGCALGLLADGWTATSVVGSGQGGKTVVLKLVVDSQILATGALLTLFMGLFGGLIPAISAMRLKPLESLR